MPPKYYLIYSLLTSFRYDASAYDILAIYDQFPTLGLSDNMIYDIIPIIPTAQGHTVVNATVFTADCGTLPDAIQISFDEVENQWVFNITADDPFGIASFPIPSM